MSSTHQIRYWISTVSKAHVGEGVKGGFCQMCHGKKSAISRLSKGDWLIYYSPKLEFEKSAVCQEFTAIGQIADEIVYSYEMTPDFVPFRRKVDYCADAHPTSIRPLLEKLSFTQNLKSWGMAFRYGLREINQPDFEIIRNAMFE